MEIRTIASPTCVWRGKNVLKPGPGKRHCNYRNEVYHKQIGLRMFQQITEKDHLALMMELLGKKLRKKTDAREFAEFLNPILDFAPDKQPTAQQCLRHPWLSQAATKTVA
ncbi:hypothetical protein L6452_29591 [Arctium lappa]|uniref:Uncharacterized protein n=1 Tax=Arctium lappa TaxID=4217 RepID=A0ACB8ZH94_ARCLA|nr:hypothetical protein L6452_46482 [Arctium lappa]KAI3663069.1 hypothetical protein L6452_46484 [Arctium lappa]KAI3696942.1 hypothetical protein L6452_29591 [Arctium lappa]